MPDEPNWRESLPEELRSDPSLETIQDVPALAKSFVNAQKLVGDRLVVPSATATPEEWNAFYTKTGRPETPDKYEIVPPEGKQNNPELEKSFRDTAHKAGLNNSQVKELQGWYEGMISQQETQFTKSIEEATAAMKSEYGVNFDKNLDNAKKAVLLYGGDEFKNFLDSTGLGNEPAVIRFLMKVGGELKEDSLGGAKGAPSQTSAQDEINAIMSDPKGPYHDRFAPGHKAAVDRVTALYETLSSQK